MREEEPEKINDLYAVFISNERQSVALFQQKSGNSRNGYLAIWDYHVMAVYVDKTNGPMVYDLDTVLPFPTPLSNYIEKVFRNSFFDCKANKLLYTSRFRVVPAQDFLTGFSSDRSRMMRSDGTYYSPPPTYPCIQGNANVVNNIDNFIDTSAATTFSIGTVLNLKSLESHFKRS